MKICNCWYDKLVVGHLTPITTLQDNKWQTAHVIQSGDQLNQLKTPTLKEKFISDYEAKNGRAKYIVVATQEADGEIDIHTHGYGLSDVYKYYIDMTFDNFEMKNNNTSKVVGYMIV